MHGLLGETSIDASAANPFAAVLPWELNTLSTLQVPYRADGTLDVLYGTALFDYAGLCHIGSALPTDLVLELQRAAEEHTALIRSAVCARGVDLESPFRFHEACQRGPGRFDMRLMPPPPPFDDAQLIGESAAWLPVVRQILGDDCKLLFQGLVVTEPGAKEQALHADGPHVPGEWRHHDPQVAATSHHSQHPCHCLTVFVPLVDLTEENGATKYLPGTQHSVLSTAALEAEASEAGSSGGAGSCARLEVSAGDAVLFDYRLFHAGGANRSTRRRPILYLIYARPWYEDNINFPARHEASLESELSGSGVPLNRHMVAMRRSSL